MRALRLYVPYQKCLGHDNIFGTAQKLDNQQYTAVAQHFYTEHTEAHKCPYQIECAAAALIKRNLIIIN